MAKEPKTSTNLVTRGPDGLLPAQREYLQKYAELGSEEEAQGLLRLTHRRVARWHREEEAFRDAYALIVEGVHEAVASQLKSIEEELPDNIRSLLEADKSISVTCPFNKEHKFHITVDHPVVRARMVEMIMKSQGHLIDRRHIKSEISISEGLNSSQRMALTLYNDGKTISEQSRLELMTLGLIESAPLPSNYNTIDSTAQEVD